MSDRITDRHIQELASAISAEEALEPLRAQQDSAIQASLGWIAARGADVPGVDLALRQGEYLLGRLPPEVQRDTLRHPQVWQWATHCIQGTKNFSSEEVSDYAGDFTYYRAIAGGASIRAGRPFEPIEVPAVVGRGEVVVPFIGRAAFRDKNVTQATLEHTTEGAVLIRAGAETIRAAASDSEEWRSFKYLDPEGRILLDDMSPFRAVGIKGETPADTVNTQAWQANYERAKDFIDTHLAHYSQFVERVLQSVVPLTFNGSSRTSYGPSLGLIGLSDPQITTAAVTENDFALALVEEARRGLFLTLNRIIPMHERSNELYYAPTQDLPVTHAELLAGMYAYPPVIDFWEATARVAESGDKWRVAKVESDRWMQNFGRLLSQAHSSPLTREGKILLGALDEEADDTVTRNSFVCCPPVDSHARAIALHHEVTWRLRNVAVNKRDLWALAERWNNGEPASQPDDLPIEAIIASDYRTVPYGNRMARTLLQDFFGPGLVAFEDRGEFKEALEESISESEGTDISSLACLALFNSGQPEMYRSLMKFPELVYDLYGLLNGINHLKEASLNELILWLRRLPEPRIV